MFVARLFAWLDRVLDGDAGAGAEVSASGRRPAGAELRRDGSPLAAAALLSVDGAGQFLLCGADSLSLGHLRSGRADLGFLADVSAVHAHLVRRDSLRDGPGWGLVREGAERVEVQGREVPPEGAALPGGARARLGANLEFRLDYPDPASASAVVELLHGVECRGARRVILLARGAGGRVRIGGSLAHHVRVPGLQFELVLEWDGEVLVTRSDLPPEEFPPALAQPIPLPPRGRQSFSLGPPLGSRPPFSLSLEPVVSP